MSNEFSLKRLGLAALVAALPFAPTGCGVLGSSKTSSHSSPKPAVAQVQGVSVRTNVTGKAKAPELYNTQWNLRGNYGISLVGSDSIKTTLEGVVIDGTPYFVTTNSLPSAPAKKSGLATNAPSELPFELIEAGDLTRVYDFDKRTMTPQVSYTHVPQLVLLTNASNGIYPATEMTLGTKGAYAARARMPDYSSAKNVDIGLLTLRGEPEFSLKVVKILGENYFAPLTEDAGTNPASRYFMPLKGAREYVLPDGSLKLQRPEGFYRLNKIPTASRYSVAQTNLPSATNAVHRTVGAATKID